MIDLDDGYLKTLNKGDTIPSRIIRAASGTKPDTDDYRIAQLQTRAVVEKHFADRGIIITVRSRAHDVRILTDAEASVCCGDRSRHGLRKMGRAKRGLEGVDVAQLTDEERVEHDRRLQKATFTYTAARKAAVRAETMRELAT